MVKKSKGYRSRTRKLLSKKPREAGKIGLSRLLYKYNPDEKVCIKIEPCIHKGMPHRRYQGKIATVVGLRGRSIIIEIGAKEKKTLIVRPEHLQPLKVSN